MVERGGLENRCTASPYRGFESLPLRLLVPWESHDPRRRKAATCGRGWAVGRFTPRTLVGILRQAIEDPGAARADAAIGRLALSKCEAADALGVSVDFLEEHVMHELRIVRCGRRRSRRS